MSKKLYFLEPNDTLEQLQDYYFPPYLTLAHMFHAPDGWSLKPRRLKQYQLQYVLEGSAEYVIQDRSYVTNRGDLLLHGPNEQHYVRTMPGTPYVCISIVFHFGSTSFPIHDLLRSDSADANHHMGNFANHALENKLSELVLHYRQSGLYHQLHCQNLLMQILLHLSAASNALDPVASKKEDANKAKLILVRNYIASHFREGFGHRDLEKLTGWSRNYIIVQFRKTFGMSPTQYLIWIRLEKAKELALQSGLSFSEIASEVGYVNIHAFGKIFKRKTGMSLSEFCASLFKDTPDN
ncbi:helix-turn-helix domain-containing protein [Paenibacillus allorhizosphaerae]|uniref:HTH-type transcriptional activator RhaR n=1 Tax=Paenibacillus allorhizosphaerae TaxID=2849866 RepID=A0ABM8VG45_9BACL|nr:AraC family transcriptional regulator [Paenibacillus allorhizosphaerae]CAG7636999.1 HTH-type transcriptional activator RhaR [Paenibacillus allorhizosphaerae]